MSPASRVVCASILALGCARSAHAQKTIQGVFNGTYRCSLGPTNVKLSIAATGENLSAQFTFYMPPGTQTQEYTFSLRGTFNSKTGGFTLTPVRWETPHQAGWVMVGLNGLLQSDVMSGNIVGPDCGAFHLERDRAESSKASTVITAQASLAPPAPNELPDVMRLCGTACFVLERDGDRYRYTWEGKTDGKIAAVVVVKRFTRESIVFEQVGGEETTLTGRMSPDGNSVVDGQIHWPAGGAVPFEASWGRALNAARVPAANSANAAALAKPEFTAEERLALQADGSLADARSRLACDARARASVGEALEIGKAAMRALELDRGICWLTRAADEGSARAQVLVALAMEHGWGPYTPDSAGAMRLYERIARASEADWRARCQFDRAMSNQSLDSPNLVRVCDAGGCKMERPPPPPAYRPQNATLAGVCRGLF